MTGLPDHNYPAFFQAETALQAVGFDVINPARIGQHDGWTWLDYMRKALESMSRADGVAYLDGWRDSRGANIEVGLGLDLSLPVHSVREWITDHALRPINVGLGRNT